MTASTWSSNSTGITMMFDRLRLAEAGRDLDVVVGRVGDQDRLLLERRLADEALARLEAVRDVLRFL